MATELDETDESGDGVSFSELPTEDNVELDRDLDYSQVVLHSTDWTTETIIGQLARGNIVLNPSFQRRDAWDLKKKSKFIESLILGLPIPQIVLAEIAQKRGKFIVLDGKQRLLSLMQYWGMGTGVKNGFSLTGMEVLSNLQRVTFTLLSNKPEFENEYNSLLNQPIRTVVIKNWINVDFLHMVFLRLNTGSVKLSPQELRQALFPGPFSQWIDEAAAESPGLRKILKLKEPDYRMRDIEILARYLSFKFFLKDYGGRMKEFIDQTFSIANKDWISRESEFKAALAALELSIEQLERTFGEKLARKPSSRSFNRAIFDCLIFYGDRAEVQSFTTKHPERITSMYDQMFDDPGFRSSIERDTAGIPNTVYRLAKWGVLLNSEAGLNLPVPQARDNKIVF